MQLNLGLTAREPMLAELAGRFAARSHRLYIVGGAVRDSMLGLPIKDLDFTTPATPDEIQTCLEGWADSIWDIGAAYGTITARKGDWVIEITTHRGDTYDPNSRHPKVRFSTEIGHDLARRDFTINAMAVDLASGELVDPFGGRVHLAERTLHTPTGAENSFTEDPLRILRAARFAARGFEPCSEVHKAMISQRDRLTIVSAERVQTELVHILMSPTPSIGLRLLIETQVMDLVIPEFAMTAGCTQDARWHHLDVCDHILATVDAVPATPILRLAALFQDIAKPCTRLVKDGRITFYGHETLSAQVARSRMRELKFSSDDTERVSRLVGLHMRANGTTTWSDRALRRFTHDVGEMMDDLLALMRADRSAHAPTVTDQLSSELDNLEASLTALWRGECVQPEKLHPELNGDQVMDILGIPPGRQVGNALAFLLQTRLNEGLLGPVEAERRLREWASYGLVRSH